MVQFQSLIDGLARSVSIKKDNGPDIEQAKILTKEAKRNKLRVSYCGNIRGRGDNFATVFSRRGEKGINQDRAIVWEEFCSEDIIFCGVFDGHGPWGHMVAKRIKKIMPRYLLCHWQENINALSSKKDNDEILHRFEIWKQLILKTCTSIDKDLEKHPRINSFESGTTALTIIKQGDHLVIANIGDSRAVLATISDEGNLVPVQLTVDLKPNLPQETARITQSKGRVHSLDDEPGVYRVWIPDGESVKGPGLATSRAFGDHFIKGFGLISDPEFTHRKISQNDQFAILATDGVWDVISNEEAVSIVSLAPGREESAKRLVEHAVCAWKSKRPNNAIDDISVICLFFHSPHLRSYDSTKTPSNDLP